MPSPLFVAESGGSRVYKVGRAGWDTGTADTGGVYTGTLRTEKFAPAGLSYFRRVVLRVWRTGAFTVVMKVWVDGVRTKVYSTAGVASDQTISITKAAPTLVPDETECEGQIAAAGKDIEVEITIASDSVTGVCLPESLEVHFQPLREAKERSTGVESQ